MTADTKPNEIMNIFLENGYIYTELFLYVICLATNVVGNTLTLTAIRRFPILKAKAYITLQSLTIADLLMSLYLIVTVMVRLQVIDINKGNTIYITGGFGGFFVYSAMLHVLLVGIDRFVAVVFPFLHASLTKRRLIYMCSQHGCSHFC